MSYHSAECFYKKCNECLIGGCACKCHKRLSEIRHKVVQGSSLSLPMTYNHHRGRPRKL